MMENGLIIVGMEREFITTPMEINTMAHGWMTYDQVGASSIEDSVMSFKAEPNVVDMKVNLKMIRRTAREYSIMKEVVCMMEAGKMTNIMGKEDILNQTVINTLLNGKMV